MTLAWLGLPAAPAAEVVVRCDYRAPCPSCGADAAWFALAPASGRVALMVGCVPCRRQERAV